MGGVDRLEADVGIAVGEGAAEVAGLPADADQVIPAACQSGGLAEDDHVAAAVDISHELALQLDGKRTVAADAGATDILLGGAGGKIEDPCAESLDPEPVPFAAWMARLAWQVRRRPSQR